MAKKEKKVLEKKNWSNSFMLIGEAKINEYTYKTDEKSEKSDWIYNSLNLGVYCGETYGTVYAELMGGYGAERDNVVYVHGKGEDGKDDFDNKFTIDWDDRFDETILESVGDLCFIKVGLEKDRNGKTFEKKFLSPYDVIAYVKENLEDGMIVNVKGNLKYSTYNETTQVKKEINSIFLSKANAIRAKIKELEDSIEKISAKDNLSQIEQNNLKKKTEELSKAEEEFDKTYNPMARFTQTMLLTKDSVGKADKDTGVLPIYAKVLDYVKEYKSKEVKTNIPYDKAFEYELNLSDPATSQKVVEKVFKVQKGVTEVTFEGDLIEGGAVVTATEDDIPDDIKTLIEIGVYTLEEALAKCTVSSGREKRMVIRKPSIKMVEDKDGNKTPIIQKFEKKYDEEDLILDFMTGDNDDGEDTSEETTETEDEEVPANDDSSWLDNL